MFHLNEASNVIAWRRFDALGEVVVCIASFSNDDFPSYRIGLPQAGTWKLALHSQDAKYEGAGQSNLPYFNADPVGYDGFGQSAALDLPAMSLVVLEKVPDGTAAPGLGSLQGSSRVWFESSYPNPAHGPTSLVFHLARNAMVELTVYDVAGRKVRTMLSEARPAGTHTVKWDGRDGTGEPVSSGVYLARIVADGESATHRLVILR